MNAVRPRGGDFFTGNTPYHTGISGTFANGSSFSYGIDSSEAVIVQRGDKSMSVDFLGGQGDVSFDATSTLYPELEYYLRIDSPASDIRGSLSLTSPRAPPHFACGPDAIGADELLVHSHGIAWSNAIPDSDAHFELTIGTEKLSWSGTAYHDKVWGTGYISPETLQSFYWGRGRLGDRYSVVWFSVREQDGTMTNSGYVARDGEILSASCECEAVQVKAWAGDGKESPSPPVPNTPVPERIAITFDLSEGHGKLLINMTTAALILEQPAVYFGTGKLEGSLSSSDDGTTLEGHAVWEIAQFPQA